MLWVGGPRTCSPRVASRSLLGCVLVTVHRAAVTLTHRTLVVVSSVAGRASIPHSLTAVAGAAHHFFAYGASLLDGSFQVLVGLLLNSLCVL